MPNYDSQTWQKLRQSLNDVAVNGSFAVAFSGGLDSRFLVHAALLAELNPILYHVDGPHISSEESAYARDWARAKNLALHEVRIDPLPLPEVNVNSRMRCYQCKRALFSRLKDACNELALCDGTHASDSQGYRPGLAALAELGILSPLATAGLHKQDIRRLAGESGMENAEQQARPCLLTRLNYGIRPEANLLRAMEDGELAAAEIFREHGLTENGAIPDFRLRAVRKDYYEMHIASCPAITTLHGEPRARLEEALRRVVHKAASLAVSRVVVLDGLSGYFDRNPL